MARFMIVTFLLLGWGFFELSGGTDFVPPEPETRPLNALLEQVAEEEALVTRAAGTPEEVTIVGAPEPTEATSSTLASFTPTEQPLANVEEAPVQAPVEEAVAPLPEIAAAPPADIRAVTGTRVNMRNGPGTNFEVLTQLVQGDQAEVLQSPGNGWVKIRVSATGVEGWMAERLMAPVN